MRSMSKVPFSNADLSAVRCVFRAAMSGAVVGSGNRLLSNRCGPGELPSNVVRVESWNELFRTMRDTF